MQSSRGADERDRTLYEGDMNDPTNWNAQQDFDSLTFASNEDAKKAAVLFNRMQSELEAALKDAERYRYHADEFNGKRGIWSASYESDFISDEETDEEIRRLIEGKDHA